MSATHAPAVRLEDLLLRMASIHAPRVLELHGHPSQALLSFTQDERHPPSVLQRWVGSASLLLAKATGQWRREQAQQRQTRTQQLDEIDSALLTRLAKAGYLSAAPLTTSVEFDGPAGHWSRRSTHAVPSPGTAGKVYLSSRASGDIVDINIADPQDLCERTYNRWIAVLHESAHCQFDQFERVFQPSPGQLPEDQQQAMERGAFSCLVADRYARTLLNENFADAYGAMMLLEASGHDPAAERIVRKIQEQRGLLRQRCERAWDTQVREPDVHLTDGAIAAVLVTRDDWRGLPPHQLMSRALEIASDAVLHLAQPGQGDRRGKSLGDHIRRRLCEQEPDVSTLVVQHLMAMSDFQIDNLPVLSQRVARHPMGFYALQAADACARLQQFVAPKLANPGCSRFTQRRLLRRMMSQHNVIRDQFNEQARLDTRVQQPQERDKKALQAFRWATGPGQENEGDDTARTLAGPRRGRWGR